MPSTVGRGAGGECPGHPRGWRLPHLPGAGEARADLPFGSASAAAAPVTGLPAAGTDLPLQELYPSYHSMEINHNLFIFIFFNPLLPETFSVRFLRLPAAGS